MTHTYTHTHIHTYTHAQTYVYIYFLYLKLYEQRRMYLKETLFIFGTYFQEEHAHDRNVLSKEI